MQVQTVVAKIFKCRGSRNWNFLFFFAFSLLFSVKDWCPGSFGGFREFLMASCGTSCDFLSSSSIPVFHMYWMLVFPTLRPPTHTPLFWSCYLARMVKKNTKTKLLHVLMLTGPCLLLYTLDVSPLAIMLWGLRAVGPTENKVHLKCFRKKEIQRNSPITNTISSCKFSKSGNVVEFSKWNVKESNLQIYIYIFMYRYTYFLKSLKKLKLSVSEHNNENNKLDHSVDIISWI